MKYSIGEFSVKTALSAPTLRYYEQEGLLSVARDSGGRRVYTEADIAWVAFIKRLKETGMRLKEIKRYASLRYQGDSTMGERLEILSEHRRQVEGEKLRWEQNLLRLEEKISYYRERLAAKNKAAPHKKETGW